MKYSKITEGKFLSRPNRFIAQVEIDGRKTAVHVKNTGRCGEILVEGATVYLEDFTENMGSRKLPYSVIGVKKDFPDKKSLMINMDSQAPNKVVLEALKNETIKLPHMNRLSVIKPETKYGDSRLDFYVKDVSGNEGYIEVKGVTLENDGVASFPDAPTVRGIKHLNELIKIKKNGCFSYVIFIIQMEDMKYFTPNRERHADFADALEKAHKEGVCIMAYQCKVMPDTLTVSSQIPVKLD